MGGQQDGGPAGGGLLHDAVEEVAAGGVEAGVGLVEQPQLGAAGDDRGDGHPPALAGGQAAGGHVAQASVEAQPGHGLGGRRGAGAGGPGREREVVGDGQVVVEEGGVAQQADPAADGLAVPAQVMAENLRLAGGEGGQAGAGPQQGGLAGPVRALHQQDLARRHIQVHSGQCREPAEQRHG